MNTITIDLDEMFENGEMDDAHAVESIGNFLKDIVKTGEVDNVKLHIIKLLGRNVDVCTIDDVKSTSQMQESIVDSIIRICNRIKKQAEDKRVYLSNVIASLEHIEEVENANEQNFSGMKVDLSNYRATYI